MSLLTKLRYVPKQFGVIAALVVAGTTVALSFAWGPDRPTYTVNSPADHITFNSITDNPNVGDERYFVAVKDASDTSFGNWKDDVTVQPGKEYLVRVYVHNNAATSLNLTAVNTRVTAALGTNTGTKVGVTGYITADNATPQKVWDDASFSSDKTFNMAYVPGSAVIYNNATTTSGRTVSDSIVNAGGALIGYGANDGKLPGCFQFSSYVTFKVKPQFAATPNFEVAKTVSKHGAFNWTENVTANTGDLVDYRVKYSNTGETQQNNVVVKDTLPAGMSYVAGSSKLYNSVNPNGKALSDSVTAGGVNIGSHAAGASSFVVFTAKVAANDKLAVCGPNDLKNIATVETDNGSKSDEAHVSVNKTCVTPQDIQVCRLSDKQIITIKASDFDASKHSKNVADCKKVEMIKVCELATKQTTDIEKSAFDSSKHSTDLSKCNETTTTTTTTPETPSKIASTGMESVLGGLIGSSALGLSISSYLRSRRALRG